MNFNPDGGLGMDFIQW